MTNSCENCRFWSPESGDCRRHPPRIVDKLVRDLYADKDFSEEAGNDIYQASRFPKTRKGDWCGMHEEKR